ncbi:MAG: hypothetical protein V3V08_17185 [Nannocystaceae bacterium]
MSALFLCALPLAVVGGSQTVGCAAHDTAAAPVASASDVTHSPSSSNDPGSGETAETPDGSDLFALMKETHVGQRPLSAKELVHESEAILIGRMVDVQPGRTIDFIEGPSNPIGTAVFHFRIDSELKGGDAGRSFAYVEYLRGGIPVDGYHEALPGSTPMLVFLGPAASWDESVQEAIDEGAGFPEGAVLNGFTTQQGLVVARDGQIEHPLTDEIGDDVFGLSGWTALDELAEEILRIMAEG